jgi:uncharacterized protein (TIGR02284 family)
MMEQYPENYKRQLEHLLNIVNDGKEEYREAAEHAQAALLKETFLRHSNERKHMAEELKERLSYMGGDTDNEEGDNSGLIQRAITSVKTALSGNNDQAMLESCRTADRNALEAYDEVLQGSILETDLKAFLTGQRFLISQAYYEVDKLYFSKFKTDPEI